MAEAVVEPRRSVYRFFCHRCNVEFEDVMQDYTCPYCATGFIERLESERDGESLNQDDGEYSDAEMSNIDDAGNGEDSEYNMMDDSQGPPVLNDLAFLMSGGNIRNNSGRQESGTVMDHFLWMIGGGRPGTGAVTAGSPFVLVGAPGDYVFGGEGLDAVVTQLLGQLENTGPAPLPRDLIDAIPNQQITAEQVEANMTCSVCWDNFTLGETVSRLECEHIFHPACITPWLQLHATCPICRRSLIPCGGGGGTPGGTPGDTPGVDDTRSDDSLDTDSSASRRRGRAPPAAAVTASTTASSSSSTIDTSAASTGSMPSSYSRVVVRRLPGGSARRRRGTQTGAGTGVGPGTGASTGAGAGRGRGGAWDSDSSSSGLTAHVTPGGLWAQLTSTLASAATAATAPDSTSTSSLNSDRDRHYMDIDFD